MEFLNASGIPEHVASRRRSPRTLSSRRRSLLQSFISLYFRRSASSQRQRNELRSPLKTRNHQGVIVVLILVLLFSSRRPATAASVEITLFIVAARRPAAETAPAAEGSQVAGGEAAGAGAFLIITLDSAEFSRKGSHLFLICGSASRSSCSLVRKLNNDMESTFVSRIQ